MFDRRTFIGLGALALAAGCGRKVAATRRYSGPDVTHVEVRKADRVMYLWSHGAVIHEYKISLGFTPAGPKQFEGDGKTPEGQYFIDRRNPESDFYLSLGISYPNARDVAFAKSQGKEPGGDIFIHGLGVGGQRHARLRKPDWTAGCIAVSNHDMAEMFRMIPLWTPITIRA